MGMAMAVLDVSGDITSSAAALSGLLLVFLGAIANSYDSFDPVSKQAVVSQYAARAKLMGAGFFASLLAIVASVVGRWLSFPWLVYLAMGSLLLSLLVISIAAVMTVRGIS